MDETQLLERARAFAGEAAEGLIAAYRHTYPRSSPADLFTSMAGDRMMRMHSVTQAEQIVA